jgi:hypothetical protein
MVIRPTHFGSYYKFTSPAPPDAYLYLQDLERETPYKEALTLEYDSEDPYDSTITGITCAKDRDTDAEEAMTALNITWERARLQEVARQIWRSVVRDNQGTSQAENEALADHIANSFLGRYGENPLLRPVFTAF